MELFGKTPKIARERPSSRFVLPDGLIGLEYEFEGVTKFTWEGAWGQMISPYFGGHNDGSLRDNGVEFVLREPLFGESLLAAVEAMDTVSRALRFKASYRTSMHVHLDMERATYPDQILSTAILYALAEPFLYKWVGQARDLCNYCLPWYRHDQHFNLFLKGVRELEGGSGSQVTSKLKALKEYKYSGLNFFSLGDYGTLEFRQCPVGLEATRVIEWINLIQSMKKYALERPKESYANFLNTAYTKGAVALLQDVFGPHFRTLTRYTARPDEAYQLGLKTASSFACSATSLGFK